MKRLTHSILFLLAAIFLLPACSRSGGNGEPAPTADAARHASLLRLDDREDYTLATILNPDDTTKVLESYLLLPEGKEPPADTKGATVVRTPLKSAVIYSSVVASAMEELGNTDLIKGVVDAEYFQQKAVTEGLAAGSIRNLGSASSPDMEAAIAMRPQAVVLNLYEGMNVPDFAKTGATVIRLLDNREQSPLGRAEWIKLIGALTGRRAQADSIFSGVQRRYAETLARSAEIAKRPSLMLENMYEGTWYVPGGNSYQARILSDAGADYLWRDDKATGSLSLSFEQVLAKARGADLWLLKVYGIDLDKKALLQMDPRYAHFSPVEKGNVYYVNTKTHNIFDRTTYHPDLLLEEYYKIFSAVAAGKQPQNLLFFARMK